MEEDEIVNKDCYYKHEPDNEFFNYSIHGLNLEGIKKYSLNPINSKYNHMIKLNKDLQTFMENRKLLQKERQKKYNKNNEYEEDILLKMYSKRKEEKNNNENNKRLNTIGNILENISIHRNNWESKKEIDPIQIRMNNKTLEKKELKKNLLNKSILQKSPINKMGTSFNYFGKNRLNNSINKRYTSFSLNKLNKSKIEGKRINYPIIKPRKIVIEYHLYNNAGIGKENKNFGHNNYMGASFNPYNYSSVPKNRVSRNIYGALFLH